MPYLEAVHMDDSIERFVKDLGTLSIDSLISSEEALCKIGLYADDYDPVTGRFLFPTDEPACRQ